MEIYLHFHTCLYGVRRDIFTVKWFCLLKLRVEAFVLKPPTFVIGYRRFGTTYKNHLQNQALDPSQVGPIDSPVSSVTNYQPTLNVWHPGCAVRIRNEENMTLQQNTTPATVIQFSFALHF
jgi:hypothetical protein